MRLFTLNEFFSNKSSADTTARRIMTNLGINDYDLDIKSLDDNAFVVLIDINDLDRITADQIEDDINKIKPNLFKNDIWVDLDKRKIFGNHSIKMVIKKIKQDEVKPDKIVYHLSPKQNRERIKEVGILPVGSKDGKWKSNIQLSYPPTVFISQDLNTSFYINRDYDVWEIDTSKIDNKFYRDINEPYTDSLMTFKKIPPHAIKLNVNFKKSSKGIGKYKL